MNPPTIVLRLLACVLCNMSAPAAVAFMHYVHQDAAAGVAMAMALAFAGATLAPAMSDVHALIDALKEHNQAQ